MRPLLPSLLALSTLAVWFGAPNHDYQEPLSWLSATWAGAGPHGSRDSVQLLSSSAWLQPLLGAKEENAAQRVISALDEAGRSPVLFIPPLTGVQMEMRADSK